LSRKNGANASRGFSPTTIPLAVPSSVQSVAGASPGRRSGRRRPRCRRRRDRLVRHRSLGARAAGAQVGWTRRTRSTAPGGRASGVPSSAGAGRRRGGSCVRPLGRTTRQRQEGRPLGDELARPTGREPAEGAVAIVARSCVP
jgi:hypothetical protein